MHLDVILLAGMHGFSFIIVYSRDNKGVGVAHKIISPASIFPDDDEAVLVR